MRKIRWGILSVAKIAVNKVIPAIQQSRLGEVVAIASRSAEKAQALAEQRGIPRAHGSYEALLADKEVDAIYLPLPNHLHLAWTLRALEAGKHVLCEKPLALNAVEAEQLAAGAARFPHLKVMEAFMYRFHPQWEQARQLLAAGAIGDLRTVHAHFSYWNVDPQNIRNLAAAGGGALMDIGCYCVSFGRWMFGSEPRRVVGVIDRDATFGTDRLASGMLDFGRGTATFTCATQLSYYQRVHLHGTEGRVEIEIPVNAPADRPARLWHQRGQTVEELTVPACDQYARQCDAFAEAILHDTPVPIPLTDAVGNLRTIDALFTSGRTGGWVDLPRAGST